MAWVEWKKDTKGRPYALVAWRDPQTGKKRRRSTGTDKQGTIDAELKKVEAIEQGSVRAPRQTSPREALDAFLAHRRTTSAPATADYYETLLRPFVRRLARVPLRSWTPLHVVTYMTERDTPPLETRGGKKRRHAKWSAGTRRHFIHAVRNFERWCERMGIETAQAAKSVPLPKHTPEDVRPFTEREVAAILTTAREKKHRLEAAVALGVYAGLSYADVRALTWDRVDLEAGWIEGRRVKTGVPFVVPVSEPLAAILKRHRAVSGAVCRGLGASSSGDRKALRSLLALAGVEEGPRGQRGFHRLRHTFATRLHREGGADLPTLRQTVGHARDSRMTGRYLTTDRAAAKAATDKAFGSKPKHAVTRQVVVKITRPKVKARRVGKVG